MRPATQLELEVYSIHDLFQELYLFAAKNMEN
jgi:hypothetical protein